MPRGEQTHRRGSVPSFNFALANNKAEKYLYKNDDGSQYGVAKCIDPLGYKRKSNPGQKGYVPDVVSLANRAEILSIMIEASEYTGQVSWKNLQAWFRMLSKRHTVDYYDQDTESVLALLSTKYRIMLGDLCLFGRRFSRMMFHLKDQSD